MSSFHLETSRKQRGTLVSPDEPRRETGVYWGYQVRIAHSLSEIFTKSPYAGGYDVTMGTSDRGTSVQNVPNQSVGYNHALIVFGGLQGLEEALANDEKLTVDDPQLLFDHYINVLPKQGSRTIRTEEALLIALAALQEKLLPHQADVECDLSDLLPRSEDTGVPMARDVLVSKKKKKRNEVNTEPNEVQPAKAAKLNPTHAAPMHPNPFNDRRRSDVESESTSMEADFEVVPAVTGHAAVIEQNDHLSRFD